MSGREPWRRRLSTVGRSLACVGLIAASALPFAVVGPRVAREFRHAFDPAPAAAQPVAAATAGER